MPKAQIPVTTARAAQHGTYGGCSWENVFYYQVGDVTGHTPGDVVESVAAATALLYSDIGAANFKDSWATTWCTVTYRDAVDSIVRVRVADAFAGSNNAFAEAADVSYLINWSSSDPRKGGKPRQYLCGVPGNALADAAALTSGVQTAFNTALTNWLTAIITPGTGRPIALQLVEMSFRDSKAWLDPPVTYPILGGTVNPVVANQRRRVDRRRPS